MTGIVEMTVDALIYLIAIIKNIKKEKNKSYIFGGNMPKNELCSKIVKESGFLEHMNSTNIETIRNMKKLRICSGNNVDVNVLKGVCDFINECVNVGINGTRKLYTIIGEMMNNATQHAYSDDSDNYAQKWLLYIENIESMFKFTFLDTGLSIPNTINKKFFNDFSKSDSSLVVSALNGEMRSQTKLAYRGEGLPIIKKSVTDGYLKKLNIISNKACCVLNSNNNKIEIQNFKIPLNGTLYYGEIDFTEEVQVNDN